MARWMLVIGLVVAALSGCGDDDDGSKDEAKVEVSGAEVSAEDFAAKAKPICEKARDAQTSFKEQLSQEPSRDDFEKAMDRFGDSLGTARDELAAVGAPAGKREAYEEMVEVLGEEEQSSKEAFEAIRTDDDATFQAKAKQLEEQEKRAAKAAGELGFTC